MGSLIRSRVVMRTCSLSVKMVLSTLSSVLALLIFVGYLQAQGGVQIDTKSLSHGTVGTPYSETLAASKGTPPYTWSIASGSLPTGLTLSSSGMISGTPTRSGKSSFNVRVADSANPSRSDTMGFDITID